MYYRIEQSEGLTIGITRFYDGFFNHLEGFEGMSCGILEHDLSQYLSEVHNPPWEIFKASCRFSHHQFLSTSRQIKVLCSQCTQNG